MPPDAADHFHVWVVFVYNLYTNTECTCTSFAYLFIVCFLRSVMNKGHHSGLKYCELESRGHGVYICRFKNFKKKHTFLLNIYKLIPQNQIPNLVQ